MAFRFFVRVVGFAFVAGSRRPRRIKGPLEDASGAVSLRSRSGRVARKTGVWKLPDRP